MYNGEVIFTIRLLSASIRLPAYSFLAFFSFSLGFLLLLLILVKHMRKKVSVQHPVFYLALASLLIVSRYLMILFRFPSRFFVLNVFDSKYFASSALNPSISDLVINLLVVVVLCYLLFLAYEKVLARRDVKRSGAISSLLTTVAVTGVLFAMLFPFVIIQTIYNNSSISLSISESLSFDSVRFMALLAVLLGWFASFLFIHISLRFIRSQFAGRMIWLYALWGIILFLLVNEGTGQRYLSSLIIGSLFLLVIGVFNLEKTLERFRYRTFIYLFTGILAFAANSYLAVQSFGDMRKGRDLSRFATNFLIDRDDFGEFLLMEAAGRISQDLFIQSRLSGPFASKEAVKQKIKQVIIPGYFNRYTVQIHLFSNTGLSLEDSASPTLDYWREETGIRFDTLLQPGVIVASGIARDPARKFIAAIPVRRSDLLQGYVVIEFLLKRIIPDNVYPELLIDNRFRNTFRSEEYSYATFDDQQLQLQYGNFNYQQMPPGWMESSDVFTSGINWRDHRHLAVKDETGRIAAVSVPLAPLTVRAADFSFLMIAGLMVVLVMLLIIGLVDFFRHKRLLLAARIQLVLNLSFFIPLIVISIITVGMTARTNQEQLNVDYLNKSQNFSRGLAAQLAQWPGGDVSAKVEQYVGEAFSMANLDANIFSASGRLLFTSQPMIFENQLLSPWIDPLALERISRGDRYFVMREQIGNLRYSVAYAVILSPADGTLFGIAALPFFQSASLLEKMQIDVLANILVLFTIIFVLLLLVFYWISTWLTFPLRLITQTLGRTNLTSSNQPLEWKSNDEIGMMASEYNRMLDTLRDNKRQLERSQRELAWREIAQQVAHEIKNPLTPIKLTLQNLERLEKTDAASDEKVKRAITTVLTQVEILDGVATSFSSLAKMPEPVMNPVELVGLINNVIELHRDSADIRFSHAVAEARVMADAGLLKRIVSNLILNACQAKRTAVPMVIRISLELTDSAARLSVADNGTGIPEPLRDKIFLPHFSTKQSGSGLGLVIARQGMEQMGGKIYFESSPQQGTVFFLELPLIQSAS
jgi:signal transduction histidine kinase